jgi:RNA polymerase sigma-70 factor (ECF subfamily)
VRRSIHHQRIHTSTPDQHTSAVRQLRLAVESGSPEHVRAVLAPDADMVTDEVGGSIIRSVHGASDVAQRLCEISADGTALADRAGLTEQDINGRSGLVMRRNGFVVGIICVEVSHNRIADVWVVVDPAKLRHWN